MSTLTINGQSYDLDKLSATAQAQVNNLSFVEREIQHLNAQLAVLNTARQAYITPLLAELNHQPAAKDSDKTVTKSAGKAKAANSKATSRAKSSVPASRPRSKN